MVEHLLTISGSVVEEKRSSGIKSHRVGYLVFLQPPGGVSQRQRPPEQIASVVDRFVISIG
jgi:hypothetical protein